MNDDNKHKEDAIDTINQVTAPLTAPERRQKSVKDRFIHVGKRVLAMLLIGTAIGTGAAVGGENIAKSIEQMQESNKLEHKFEGEVKYYQIQPGESWTTVAKLLKNYNNYNPSDIIDAIQTIPDNTKYLQGLQPGNWAGYRELPGDNPIEDTEPTDTEPIAKDEAIN
ncbi:MAG: hypothetical protein WCP11_01945 [Candidatus Saccharibacteria bacterium]